MKDLLRFDVFILMDFLSCSSDVRSKLNVSLLSFIITGLPWLMTGVDLWNSLYNFFQAKSFRYMFHLIPSLLLVYCGRWLAWICESFSKNFFQAKQFLIQAVVKCYQRPYLVCYFSCFVSNSLRSEMLLNNDIIWDPFYKNRVNCLSFQGILTNVKS